MEKIGKYREYLTMERKKKDDNEDIDNIFFYCVNIDNRK